MSKRKPSIRDEIDDPLYREYRKRYTRKDDAEYAFKDYILKQMDPDELLRLVRRRKR